MKCQICSLSGRTSTVEAGEPHPVTVTWRSMSIDGKGSEHRHGTSLIVTPYRCSLGHRWREEYDPSCKACQDGSRVESALPGD